MAGKKRGAARQRKRADAVAVDLTDAVALSHLETKPDSDLFVLDKSADLDALKPSRKERRLGVEDKEGFVTSKGLKRARKRALSENDRRKVQKIIKNQGNDVAKITALVERSREKCKAHRNMQSHEPSFDLWDDDAVSKAANGKGEKKKRKAVFRVVPCHGNVASGTLPVQVVSGTGTLGELSSNDRKARELKKKTEWSKVAVDIAHSGQSYRPDVEMHQDVIGEALSIELRRKEAEREKQTPIGGGYMREETLAVLVDGNDSEENDGFCSEDEHVEENDGVSEFVPMRNHDKLTRAQRNKKRRVKQLEIEQVERKRAKKFLSSVNEANKVKKELDRKERQSLERKEVIRSLKEKARPRGADLYVTLVDTDPIMAPTLPVALTSELAEYGGSLRSVKPKGSLMMERLESLAARKMANKKKSTKKKVVQGKRRKPRNRSDYLLI